MITSEDVIRQGETTELDRYRDLDQGLISEKTQEAGVEAGGDIREAEVEAVYIVTTENKNY